MKIKKTVLGQIDKVYATCIGNVDGKMTCIGASEGEGPCHAYDGEETSILWERPGGTMNIVPIPGRDNAFFATQHFLPVFDAKQCSLHYIRFEQGTWQTIKVMDFPYLHRFDLFESNGDIYFIGASLCEGKTFVQDWRQPGSVYIGKLKDDYSQPFEVKNIYHGITKNHGFCRVEQENGLRYLITGVEGVFSFEVPESPMDHAWTIQRIMTHEVSDIAVCDLDQDGEMEYATIEPFHGNTCVIYKKEKGTLRPIKTIPIAFGHVIWGGQLGKRPTFLLGERRDAMRLITIHHEQGNIVDTLMDEQTGPSQISVRQQGDKTYVLSANRQINELALYECSEA